MVKHVDGVMARPGGWVGHRCGGVVWLMHLSCSLGLPALPDLSAPGGIWEPEELAAEELAAGANR